MPISDIQAMVLKQIAANRSPESYLAGATVVHRADDTPRFSQDQRFRMSTIPLVSSPASP